MTHWWESTGRIKFRVRRNPDEAAVGRDLWLTCDCSWPFTVSPSSFLLPSLGLLGPFNFLAPIPLALAPEGFSWLPSCFLDLAKGRGLSCSPLMCLSYGRRSLRKNTGKEWCDHVVWSCYVLSWLYSITNLCFRSSHTNKKYFLTIFDWKKIGHLVSIPKSKKQSAINHRSVLFVITKNRISCSFATGISIKYLTLKPPCFNTWQALTILL